MEAFHEFMRRNPLYVFSIYTGKQADIVNALGAKIEQQLNDAVTPTGVDGALFQEIYGEFWLWILGAYEIVRTMSQAKECFSSNAAERIGAYKRRLAVLRIPFAKQEYAGRAGPIGGEPSVYGIDTEGKDFQYEVRGQVYSIRGLIREFGELVTSIDASDVLRPLQMRLAQRI